MPFRALRALFCFFLWGHFCGWGASLVGLACWHTSAQKRAQCLLGLARACLFSWLLSSLGRSLLGGRAMLRYALLSRWGSVPQAHPCGVRLRSPPRSLRSRAPSSEVLLRSSQLPPFLLIDSVYNVLILSISVSYLDIYHYIALHLKFIICV